MSSLNMQIARHRDLTTKQAETLTERIKSLVGDLMMLVAKGWQGRVWLALGYESWPDYIKGEFDHAPLSLPRDERKAVVALLRGHGMSTRAIGAATGVDQATVTRDLATDAFASVDDEPVLVTGLDGKVRNYAVTCTTPETSPQEEEQPAPTSTITCPTCGGTGKVTQ